MNTKKFLREWIWPYALVALVVIPLRSAIADSNWVPSGSMKPTLLEGELIYVNKLAYDLRVPLTFKRIVRWDNPRPGEVVVFFSPEDGKRLVKRVIAAPGDTVELRDEKLVINGKPMRYDVIDAASVREEIYEDRNPILAIEHGPRKSHDVIVLPSRAAMRDFGPIKVPEGKYFMMGDSRDNSYDSRYFGVVDRDQIVGRAQRVIVSFDVNRHYGPRFGRFFEAI
ncbi:MAG TPA: signal peptidase I [Steroidobacteraceae bacterium]|nr:signal peptidase I [Steroidobacteraceae bacterium]